MTFQPLFVPGGVYLRTASGELIGRPDEAGSPFASLDEARSNADWLELALHCQKAERDRQSQLDSTDTRWHHNPLGSTPGA